MSKCVELESSMTGSTGAGPLKPPVSSSPLNGARKRSSSGHRPLDDEPAILDSPSCQEQTPILHKMTPVRLHSGQPIQLTPLWEHVVRTRRFPCEIDTRETFDEIRERLRDPEWEVRQHALRVLVDVLPTLDPAIIDDAMTTVLPELVNNLGHLAPAVRKGALDTLRVYLLCSRKREDIVDLILNEALIREDTPDGVRANVTLGVILSTPSLLFPSSSNSRPTEEIIRRAIGALVNRLSQVNHQEAALRSLVKIQELLGSEDFYLCLNELDAYAKRDYEILCDVYKIKPSAKSARRRKRSGRTRRRLSDSIESTRENRVIDESNDDSGPSCDCGREAFEPIAKNGETLGPSSSSSPSSRIVLETEIKFNEETAIKMTIIEQRDEDIDAELDFEWSEDFPKSAREDVASGAEVNDARENEMKDVWIERRKTPRRVHFGGEIVKLRTPDSDDSELVRTDVSQTRIPIPVSPATGSTSVRSRKSRSNPGSPNIVGSRSRVSKSLANSPRRDFYVHDASLSPKKSILATKSRNDSRRTLAGRNEESKRKMEARVDSLFGRRESKDESGWAFEIFDSDDYSNSNLVRSSPVEASSNPKSFDDSSRKEGIFAKSNGDGSRHRTEIEIGRSKVEASPRKVDASVTDFPSVSDHEYALKKDTKNSTEPTIERTWQNGGADLIDGNRRIGDIPVNERITDRSYGESPANFRPDKTECAGKSASARKNRNSAGTWTEQRKTNEIGIGVLENLEDNGEKSGGSVVDPTFEKIVTIEDSIDLSKEETGSAGPSNDATVSRKNRKIEPERPESVADSPAKLESSREKSSEEEQRGKNDATYSQLRARCERAGEKLESANERSVESSSNDSSRRVSPRSLRKHEFEAFPRKERNYILMELSSPAKTSSRRTSEDEKIDEPKRLDASENNSSTSYEVSSASPSIDRPIVDSTDDRSLDDSTVAPDIGNVEKSLVEKTNRRDDGRKTATDKDAGVKVESFDLEDNSLNDIVIAEPPKFRESNWEDLGLVDREVLDDLHNKDDWRARVRGLERVASALRTPSALIAIEPRLGSLLQAVLGGERSCRVAAAGMAVARIVVAGVSEEALKRRLPQVAWGLARQGGPNAAQLARVAMLRLRPALLFEQLLQPHCINARNAKTRENALQLLIFSLVTFPSTEFKVENVAYKVACMVADKRRRVRQATLDTLAVLAQIYEPEEVTKAGKLAAKGQKDGDAMLAAIRARLARKSLPMVSADGLVLYGLQISPTIQIATGPDVDWIVAGSGSVSPGTGRTRGQIIATTTRQEKNAKSESSKSVSSSKRLNFVALGVAMETKNEREKTLDRKLVRHSAQNEPRRTREELSADNGDEDSVDCEKIVTKTRLTGTLRQYRSATDRLDVTYETNEANPICLIDDKDVITKQRQMEENFHRRMDETGMGLISQDTAGNRLESRIPVPQMRDRETKGKETTGIGAIHPTRRLPQKGNNSQNWSAGSRVSDVSRPQSTHRDDHSQTDINSQRYERVTGDSSPRHLSPTGDAYRSIYRQGRGFADGNVYREVQTAPTNTSYDVTRRRQSLKDSSATRYVPGSRRSIFDESQASSTMTTTVSSNDNEIAGTSRMPNGKRAGNGDSIFYKGDKNTIEEEENNEVNKRHYAVQANSYQIQNSNDRSSQCSDRKAQTNNDPSDTSSSGSSNVVLGEHERSEISGKLPEDRAYVEEAFIIENDENVVPALPKSPGVEKSFDVITHETNPSRRNSIEFGISPRNVHSNTIASTLDREIDESEAEKDSSTEEVSVMPRIASSHENFIIRHDSESSDNEETANDLGRNYETAYVANDTNSFDDGVSKVSDDSPLPGGSRQTEVELCGSSKNSARADSAYAIRSIEVIDTDNSSPSTDENDGVAVTTMSYVAEYAEDALLKSGVRLISQHVTVGSPTRSNNRRSPESRRESRDRDENVISIILSSRPQSRDSYSREDKISIGSLDFRQSPPQGVDARSSAMSHARSSKLDGSTNDSDGIEKPSNENPAIRPSYSRDSTHLEKIDRTSNTGNESATLLPDANGSQASMSQMKQIQKSVATSRISRMRQKSRTNVARVAPMQPSGQTIDRSTSKSKMFAQQCFTQLDSNDWEVTMKGLKGLSQIARQQPEQLDSCAPGTVGRLLGRHVRNLRSQVSRAACLAAGDVFGSQARCIDQDLDDIAGPLLHRTADTNKFLRADSNEALDRMVEYLPPNKTIAVIVHRGATHQNAIVRATTARLLASIVDRVGPDLTMSMPRDVREKLIATGAKLLMDGNLEARNQAKRMFRKLSRCEGFRKVLRDSVPDTTLRHIDKTLRSL